MDKGFIVIGQCGDAGHENTWIVSLHSNKESAKTRAAECNRDREDYDEYYSVIQIEVEA